MSTCHARFHLVLVAAYGLGSASAQTIHQYADAAACQMGGREARYLPAGITPGGGNRIPITWHGTDDKGKVQGGEVFWNPDGSMQFVIKDDTSGVFMPIGKDYPEKNANGPFNDPTQSAAGNATGKNLKCDHFSYVEASCTPDQYVREVLQGSCKAGVNQGAACSADGQCPGSKCGDMVRWHVLFRRKVAAAKTGCTAANWGPTCDQYYEIVDAAGLKVTDADGGVGTYGTVWLDGTQTAAKDPVNGFLAGAMPRPGGKRPDKRVEGRRATAWYDTVIPPKPGGNCNDCHGTPFNGSDWIKGSGLKFQNDERLPWWFAGNEVGAFPENRKFFDTAKFQAPGMPAATDYSCGTCHARWLQSARSTPGGEATGGLAFARLMTMVMDPSPADPFVFRGLAAPYDPLISSYRKDAEQALFLNRNAQQTHQMPDPMAKINTVAQWLMKYNLDYSAVACCGANRVGMGVAPNTDPVLDCKMVKECTELVSQKEVKAVYITPWMQANGKEPTVPPKSNGTQFISPPDAAVNVSLTLVDCPAGVKAPKPGDRCFHLTWSDSNGSPFNAPQSFRYKALPNRKVSDPDWPAGDVQETEYCGDGVPTELTVDATSMEFPKATENPVPAPAGSDAWRYKYESFGVLPKCQKMALRLCGGWCQQNIQLLGEAAARPRLSTEVGRILALANDTMGDVSKQVTVTRSGFRKNLTTGRFVQTVTLTNSGGTPLPTPISLVLQNLTNATLYNLSGMTGNPPSPYVNVMAGGDSLTLGVGQSVSVTLEFTDPTNQSITYDTQELALSVSAACSK